MATTQRLTEIKRQVKAWLDQSDDVLELLNVEPESITLEVAGKELVVSLPAAFLSGQRNGKAIDDGEQFFVTAATYEEQMDDVLQRMNEKLERLVPAESTAAALLDTVVATLNNYSTPKKPSMPREASLAGSDIGSDEEKLSEAGSDMDDDAPDFYGYDMATGEDIASEREVKIRKASYLHKLAEQARSQCAEACQAETVFAEDTPYAILQWCAVEALPDLLRVKLSWDLQGFMRKADALALGLVYEEPLIASLAFPASRWADPVLPSMKSLSPEAVLVSQDSTTSRRESASGAEDENQSPGRKNEREAYGVKVLIPELIHRFFRAHARIRCPHLDDDKHMGMLISVGVEPDRAALLIRHARATSAESAPLDLNALVHSQHTNAELQQELGAINRAELGCTDEHLAVDENMFTALLHMIGGRLARAATWCPVCRQPHASPGMRLRPCNNDLCLYRFEELGLGAAILPEVLENEHLVELELGLATMAAASTRADAVFEPFPSFLLEGQENRGRAGWFNTSPSATAARSPKQPVAANAQAAAGGSSDKATKLLVQLREALEAVPPLKDLTDCRTEAALIRAFVHAWHTRPAVEIQAKRAKLRAAQHAELRGLPAPATPDRDPKDREKEMLPYDLVRFVLSTNRLSLRHLADTELLPVKDTVAQFLVLTADPEKEAAFAQLRAAAGGSFFAFHGSKGENWYSILRNGLRSMSNTSYMLVGAAYGPGIYLAPALATSVGYAGSLYRGGTSSSEGWKAGAYKDGCTCIAICEVARGTAKLQGSFCYVVPPGMEDRVVIRYLLVYNTAARQTAAHNIADDKLDGFSLSTHFQTVTANVLEARRAQQLARHVARKQHAKEMAAEAAARAASMAASERRREAAAQEGERRSQPASVGAKGGAQGTRGTSSSQNSAAATQAIQKELAKIMALQQGKAGKGKSSLPAGGFEVDVDEADLYKWRVKLRPSLFAGSPLEGDLRKAACQRGVSEVAILLEIRFPSDFPWQPPFIRVVSPRFAFHTGHVTIGGSICMELLTASGWTPAYALESVLVQIIAEMMHGNARLDAKSLQTGREYSEEEAKAAFTRVARDHGWKV